MNTQFDFKPDGTAVSIGGSLSGLPLFARIPSMSDVPEHGFLRLDINNGLLPRAAFKEATARILKMQSKVLTETAWQLEFTQKGFVDAFSLGDGVNTFRIPFIPLEYWYGTTRVGRLIRQLTLPATASTTFIYDEIMDDDYFVTATALAVSGQSPATILHIGEGDAQLINESPAGMTGHSHGYVKKGQRLRIRSRQTQNSASADVSNRGLRFFSISAPLEYPLLKMYDSATVPSTVDLGEMVQLSTGALQKSEFSAWLSGVPQLTAIGGWAGSHPANNRVLLSTSSLATNLPSPGLGWLCWRGETTDATQHFINLSSLHPSATNTAFREDQYVIMNRKVVQGSSGRVLAVYTPITPDQRIYRNYTGTFRDVSYWFVPSIGGL